MSRGNEWTNDDGLIVGFGVRDVEDERAGVTNTAGDIEEIVLDFAYDDLPTYGANDGRILTIPANSLIVSSRLNVKTAAAGGTSYTVGLHQAGGTAIDADGLHTAAQLVTASLTAGAWLTGGGALVGAGIGANGGQIVVAATGTFTAGEYRLVVEYMRPKA